MNKITLAVFALGLFGSVTAFAAQNESRKPETANQIDQQVRCADGRCPGYDEQSVSNNAIHGQQSSSAQAAHTENLKQNEMIPGKTQADVNGKEIQGQDNSTADEKHQEFLCQDGRCPGQVSDSAEKK